MPKNLSISKFMSIYSRDGGSIGRVWCMGPFILIVSLCLLIYCSVENNRLGYYIPDSPGELSCEFTGVDYYAANGTMYANIWGRTVNSTVCAGQNMSYYEYYYDPYGLNNLTLFEHEVSKKFPTNGNYTIDCSVISTCSWFQPFRYPDNFSLLTLGQIVVYTLFCIGLFFSILHSIHAYIFFKKRRELALLV